MAYLLDHSTIKVRCVVLQVKVALRLSLAVNVIICSLGIFRISLVHLPAADADCDRDVMVDVTTGRRPEVSRDSTSAYLVPNIVHYIWLAHPPCS